MVRLSLRATSRNLGFLVFALVLPIAVQAQSSSDRDARERERQAARDAAREAARERSAERARLREEQSRAGALDTVVTFDARGTVSVSCPGGSVIVTGSDKNEVRVRARTESGAIRFSSNGMRATLEPSSGRGCSDGGFEVTVPVGARVTA